MNRRGRLAVAIAVSGSVVGLRVARVNYRLGWWTYQAGKRVAHVLVLPERRGWR